MTGSPLIFRDLGAKLEILSGPLAGVYDPRGMGKIFFAMLAGFAEMEREMMMERTNDGLARAAAEGRHGGRRPVERTVSRRALYNAFKAHDADRTESA